MVPTVRALPLGATSLSPLMVTMARAVLSAAATVLVDRTTAPADPVDRITAPVAPADLIMAPVGTVDRTISM